MFFRLFTTATLSSIGLLHSQTMDPHRPYLDNLRKSEESNAKEYVAPFIIIQTAMVTSQKTADALAKLRQYLKETMVPIRGHFSKAGVTYDQVDRTHVRLPAILTTGKELSGINGCSSGKCLEKLHTGTEKSEMEKSTDKLTTYHQLIVDRIRSYLKGKQVKGYEDRLDDVPYVKQMFSLLPFVKASYPKCFRFGVEDFWRENHGASAPLESFLRMEVVKIWPTRLSPVLRISEVFEFEESKGHIFFELPIYTNHYFDSSLRFYELISLNGAGGKNAFIMTDVMEIDELKKSGLIRFLYTGEMEESVAVFQREELQSLAR